MTSKSYRVKKFFNTDNNRSLIVDTSAGLSLGPLPGLEILKESVTPLLPLVDGIITSPGQSRLFVDRTHEDAALLVRADWTNALRMEDFVLPHETIHHITVLDPKHALDLGASAIVLYFLLGHEEIIEADCLKKSVQFAIQGSQTGLPLLLDLQPIGDRIVLRNKAIELGVSYALEAGADGIAIPWPGEESFELIIKMAAGMPVWLKLSDFHGDLATTSISLELGGSGIWLDEKIFGQTDMLDIVQSIAQIIHPNNTTQVEG